MYVPERGTGAEPPPRGTAGTTAPNVRQVPEIRPSVTIDPMHLCLTRKWPNGASNNIHLLENSDLGSSSRAGTAPDRNACRMTP
jgi:hypothetical protein